MSDLRKVAAEVKSRIDRESLSPSERAALLGEVSEGRRGSRRARYVWVAASATALAALVLWIWWPGQRTDKWYSVRSGDECVAAEGAVLSTTCDASISIAGDRVELGSDSRLRNEPDGLRLESGRAVFGVSERKGRERRGSRWRLE